MITDQALLNWQSEASFFKFWRAYRGCTCGRLSHCTVYGARAPSACIRLVRVLTESRVQSEGKSAVQRFATFLQRQLIERRAHALQ